MSRSVRIMRAEARKLFCSRAYLGALAISVGVALLAIFVDAAVAGKNGQPRLGTQANVHQMLKLGAVTCIAMLVVGILSSGGEYRHHTIVPTLLVAPRRGTVVAAKAASVLFAGVVLSALTFGLGLACIYGLLVANDIHNLPSDTLHIALGSVAASTLFGLIGTALGFITRSTVGAVVLFVGWVVFGEPTILTTLFPHLEKWLPVGLATSLTNALSAGPSSLTPWAAAGVLAGYVAVLIVVAGAVVARRDVV
jgi:ABC-2 type transport system permease protein